MGRRPSGPAPAPVEAAAGPEVEFSVVVRGDGKVQFESRMVAPLLGRTDEQVKAATEAWMEMMIAGLNVSKALRPAEERGDG